MIHVFNKTHSRNLPQPPTIDISKTKDTVVLSVRSLVRCECGWEGDRKTWLIKDLEQTLDKKALTEEIKNRPAEGKCNTCGKKKVKYIRIL